MTRSVQPEWLDVLPADHPSAIRSRCDLRRVNAWMRSPAILARALQQATHGRPPRHLVDLGAGDGNLLLEVARRLATSWTSLRATLLDRQPVVTPQTLSRFARFGWRAEALTADALEWARAASQQPAEAVTANLFLHHLTSARLVQLFETLATRARLFVALEPRRGTWPWLCSHWLWAIGCHAVTRHDAVASVRAGFAAHELSALWPAGAGWRLIERPAGLFSHVFIAQRGT